MRKRIYIVVLAATSLLAAACSEELEQNGGDTDGLTPLVITAGQSVITVETKSVASKDAWEVGTDQIGVTFTQGDYSTTGVYTITSTDGATEPVEGKEIYWQNTTAATVAAWYPATASADAIDISDQSTEENYLAADILTASATTSFGETATLSFGHGMAKVRITVVPANSSDIVEGIDVATYTQVQVTDGAVYGVEDSDGTIAAYWDTSDITDTVDSDTYAGIRTYEVLVPPQTVAAKKSFVRATVDGELFLYIPSTSISLAAGYQYNYTLIVDSSTMPLNLTGSSVTDWKSTEVVTEETTYD